MIHQKEPFALTLTQEVLNVLNAARDTTLTEERLRAIAAGEVFTSPAPFCVGGIGYQNDGESILFVQFTSGTNLHSADIENLNDFRQQFRDAANYGHSVRFIINSSDKRIEFLSTVPCECPCKKE